MVRVHHGAHGRTAVGFDGQIYAIGGFLDSDGSPLASAEVYDPSSNSWTPISSMPTAARDLAAAQGIERGVGRLFAFGGHGEQPPFTTVQVYSP